MILRNQPTKTHILTICRFIKGVRAKNLDATLSFVDFSDAFDSIRKEMMEQILQAYGLFKEIINDALQNMKAMVGSPDGDIKFERRYISTIYVDNLPRLCTSKFN